MRKQGSKLLLVVLTFFMIFGCVNVYPVKAKTTQKEYEIYPKPHSINYEDGNYSIDAINIVYENGIDADTKTRLNEILTTHEIEGSVSKEIQNGKTNILVGINNSGEFVDEYVKANYLLNDPDLFSKLDSYLLTSRNGIITILGKDSDAAFYGITSLYHIFNQLDNNSIYNFTIEDCADVASRGFIEGYYGNPWSTEDRVQLMKWGGYYKLNSYFYAPKDDPKHNAKWRELYSQEEIETKIKPLAKAGNESKCRFVFALHPYMNNPIRYNSEDNYQADLKVMQAKFAQVIEGGVRQIAILADDAGNVGSQNYIRTLNDMTAWIKEMQKTYPDLKLTLPFCTQEYMYNGESYYRDFPENVQIVMTGGRIWGEVSQSFTNTFTNNTGRGPYLWINWPCTDNSKKHLIMGGYDTFLHPNVDPEKIQGIVLNPMQQSEPSKVAIFGNACYSWNIWESKEEANQCWNDSFKYVDHNNSTETEASNALRELSKHMINQNMDSRVTALQESVDLKDRLTTFKDLLNKDATIDEEVIDDLINEFKILQNATKVYRENAGDKRIRDQIVYWLNCWDDTTNAALSFLNGIKVLQQGADNSLIWENFSAGQSAFAKSKTYGFHYVDHLEYAEVGVQHIVPFIRAMESYLSLKVSTIVDPDKQVISVITNRNDTPTQSTDLMLDGKDDTFAQWKTPNSSKVGEYVGITYTKAIDLKEVKFLMSNSATNNKNTFAKAKLQYTEDGKIWKDIEGSEVGNKALQVSATGLNLSVKGIRVICSEATPDIWLAIREIYVNGKSINNAEDQFNPTVIKTNTYRVYQSYNESNLTDGNDNTFVWYQTNSGDMSLAGDYVGLDLGKVVPIDNVRFIMGNGDYWSNYDLEYSLDGNEYTKFKSYSQDTSKKVVEEDFNGIQARYVRVKNTKDKHTWLKMSAFEVTPILSSGNVDTNNDDLKSITIDITNDTGSITPSDNITLNPQEYIGLTLPRIRDLSNIDLQLVNGEDLTLQVSKNNVDWQNIDSNELPDGRYIRLINQTDKAITFNITKFVVTSFEITTPSLYDTNFGITPGWGESEDCRDNGAAFDNNIDTITEFGTLPQKGQYAIYDLGQVRNINKIAMYCQDSAVNYLRDAEILISNDLNEWTKVITIGDGIENKNDANVKCIDSDAGYKASSTYPNKVYVEGNANNIEARYLKILVTATNNNRAVVFNEIVINDGEYVKVSNNPTFASNVIEEAGFVPENMFDGDLTSAYKPSTKEAGYISYILSEKLDVKKMNIVQSGSVSKAKVLVLVDQDDQRQWVEVGTLDKSLNEIYLPFWNNIYELKIEWEANNIPTIAEIVLLNDSKYGVDHSELTNYINSLEINELEYTASSYQAFSKVLAEAKAINSDNNSSASSVDKALADLKEAVNNLVKRGNTQLIKDKLTEIEALIETDYSPESWQKLQVVVNEASELLNKDTAEITLEEVSEIVNKLDEAISNLEIKADKSLLQIAIEEAKKITDEQLNKVVPIVVEEFKAALKEATEILADDNATQSKINASFDRLASVMQKLEFYKGDKKALQELVNKIELLNSNDFTKTSWDQLMPVLNIANQVLANENALVKEVNDAYEALVRAYLNLRYKPNKDLLEDLINTASKLNAKDYTVETYNLLQTALKEANNVLTSETASQEQINQAYNNLNNAIKNLVKVNQETSSKQTALKTGDISITPFVLLAMLSIVCLLTIRKKENI